MRDEEDVVDSMNINAGCEFDIVIDMFEDFESVFDMIEEKEEDEFWFWFWKYDLLKFDDAFDTFEEEERIDDSAIELLEKEKDALNFL